MRPVILILEDEIAIAALLENALIEDGYDILRAETVAQFRDLIAVEPVDLFLMDLNLPDGTGLAFVREIRKVSDVGIILLTGRIDEMDQVVGLEIGADDYIPKPFRIRELRARINSVYRRTQHNRFLPAGTVVADPEHADGGAQPVLFHGWALNPDSRRLTDPSGDEVKLTTAEFNLLAALVKNRNRVLSRDQIMTAIKGQDWAIYDRVVDGLVSRLRQKVAVDAGKEHFIKTVRGIGYMFSAD